MLVRSGRAFLGLASVLVLSGAAVAAEPLAPPAMYPRNTWQGKSTAVVRVLNRLDSRVETVKIPVGETSHYETLEIGVTRCLQHAPTARQDAAAWLDIQDRRAEGATFHGWMLAAEPSLGILESPIYDVHVVTCEGNDIQPMLPTLEQPAVPPLPGKKPDSSQSGQEQDSGHGSDTPENNEIAPSSSGSSTDHDATNGAQP
ncbi:DUF2155 domain-containing protein [Acetobacter sp.]|uniref:DUF2155 domain-containing protein n=1 Tax=Acetobacter sp. TaxID=440 RepID=UPI0025B7CD88|nr:DUF2155 domain-containing protein [Acetobacter sp.]MCH4091426.1 DUF2155 domain-containing protein [Acetobacter sp.]MCI1299404.1 DUF2155 domain-containing protein [Acetobacter sp.]MCI1316592.1 DUF2155 domain-containing protein [Acetobacter sp.]